MGDTSRHNRATSAVDRVADASPQFFEIGDLLLRAAETLDAKRLDPNCVPSNLAAEIEFSTAQFVERFNLKGLADCSREGPFGGARHPTDRVRNADNAHPVPDPDVAARDVS